MVRGRGLLINDLEVDDYDTHPLIFGDITVFRSGLFIIINSTDFLLKWDEKTRVYVTVSQQYLDRTSGLCGNNNEDQSDDLITASGVIGSIDDMARSWQLSSQCASLNNYTADSSDPCFGHDERRSWATTNCDILTSTSLN
ncbi:unnamed protein product, partial [Didymodactylos carnosus]